jgi:hypothetical protein
MKGNLSRSQYFVRFGMIYMVFKIENIFFFPIEILHFFVDAVAISLYKDHPTGQLLIASSTMLARLILFTIVPHVFDGMHSIQYGTISAFYVLDVDANSLLTNFKLLFMHLSCADNVRLISIWSKMNVIIDFGQFVVSWIHLMNPSEEKVVFLSYFQLMYLFANIVMGLIQSVIHFRKIASTLMQQYQKRIGSEKSDIVFAQTINPLIKTPSSNIWTSVGRGGVSSHFHLQSSGAVERSSLETISPKSQSRPSQRLHESPNPMALPSRSFPPLNGLRNLSSAKTVSDALGSRLQPQHGVTRRVDPLLSVVGAKNPVHKLMSRSGIPAIHQKVDTKTRH